VTNWVSKTESQNLQVLTFSRPI